MRSSWNKQSLVCFLGAFCMCHCMCCAFQPKALNWQGDTTILEPCTHLRQMAGNSLLVGAGAPRVDVEPLHAAHAEQQGHHVDLRRRARQDAEVDHLAPRGQGVDEGGGRTAAPHTVDGVLDALAAGGCLDGGCQIVAGILCHHHIRTKFLQNLPRNRMANNIDGLDSFQLQILHQKFAACTVGRVLDNPLSRLDIAKLFHDTDHGERVEHELGGLGRPEALRHTHQVLLANSRVLGPGAGPWATGIAMPEAYTVANLESCNPFTDGFNDTSAFSTGNLGKAIHIRSVQAPYEQKIRGVHWACFNFHQYLTFQGNRLR
mmetsp:Transcript_15592/g.29274  ORF Transcript_15592/g.29274 Transcript_15592/m.29274 type:complete len:318 (-) Transcript_15592:195-1148(-)